MGQLALTFRGPFVYHIQAASVDVYAPICASHRAAISNDSTEYPLCGRHRQGGHYTYVLDASGIDNNLGDIGYPGSGGSKFTILTSPPTSTIDKSQARFCLTVPRPLHIWGVNAAETSVMKDNSTGQRAKWATGLTFYYSCDLTKHIRLVTPEKVGVDLTFDNDLPSLPAYADIEVHYVGPDADDAEHLDAIACFEQTMKLLNLPWWLYYGQSGKVIEARTGADCKSLAVVLDSGSNSQSISGETKKSCS